MEDGEERGTLPGIVIAMILAGAWALTILTRVDDGILRYAAGGDKTSAFGLFLGDTILPVAVIWAVLYFAYVRRRAPSQGFFYFMLMFVLVSGIDLGGLALRTGAVETVMTPSPPASGDSGGGFGQQASPTPQLSVDTVIANSRTNIDAALRPRGGQVYYYPGATGAGGDLDRRVKALADGLGASAHATRNRIDALNYPAFMLPQAFVNAAGLVRAQTRLDDVRAALQTDQTRRTQLIDAYRTWLQTDAPLSAAQRTEAWNQLQTAIKSGGAAHDRYQALMLQQIAEFEAMIRDMRNSRQPWQLLAGKLFFADDHDIAVFRRHSENVAAIDRELHAVFAGVN